MQKRIFFGLICSASLIFTSCQTSTGISSKPFHLVILNTNDTHGHPVNFEMYPMKNVGGLPARATLVESIRKQETNVLLLDAGDLNTGRPESLFFNAEPDIKGYNYIKYDAVALGNHEFDKPISVLEKQANDAHFSFLSANVTKKDSFPITGVKQYIIKDFDGVKVAIFGLITPDTPNIITKTNADEILISNDIETAKKLVPELHKQADVVIALVHLGIDTSGESGSILLARKVPGIDLIVDGHTHTQLDKELLITNEVDHKQVPIVQAWMWGLQLGRTDMVFEKGKDTQVKYKPIAINLKKVEKNAKGEKIQVSLEKEIPENQELLKMLTPYVAEVDQKLSEKIGVLSEALDDSKVRSNEAAIGNLLAESMLFGTESYKTVIAITNSGSIRAGMSPGDITKKHVFQVSPFDNSLVVMNLTGAKIQELGDFFAAIAPNMGSFPQVAGIKITLNRKTKKATNILVGNKPLDVKASYKVVVNSFIAAGGDGYTILTKNGTGVYDTSVFMRDALMDFIKAKPAPISTKTDGRLKIIE